MRNERLIANAGSGKTHALTTRMIHLLAQDIEPRKIAALTFTRKSAGEFLSAVFVRLAEAALNPQKLAELCANESLAQIDAARCRSMIQKLALQLSFLGMGTIDSLFARIARAFPLESGLAEDFSIAAEAQIDAAREKTLAEIFAKESTASLADFIDLVRRITRNQGERDVFNRLLAETQNLHEKFLETPANVTWGDAAAIWQNGCGILNAGEIAPVAQQLWEEIRNEHPNLSAEASQSWEAGVALAVEYVRPNPFSDGLKKFISKLSNEKETDDGQTYIPTRNAHAGRVFLSPTIRALRDELRNSLLKPEFESLLARSRSLHAFMRKFEEVYSQLVRSTGLVTFGDITDSLARKANPRTQEGEIWRNSVAYRTDQKFDHWLLDEFQDTSRPQWKILKTFIDEVVMDPEGQRSFFYVGDTKQAIYSWRGGDPNLFFEIFKEFNELQSAIQDAPPLAKSWRSCPEILDFVNQVFGDLAPVKTILEIPEAAAEKWTKAWTKHTASPKTKTVKGYAEWAPVPQNDGDDEEEGSATDRKSLAILKQTEPWKRGLSCAVLKPDNNGVAALASLLQSHDIPVAVEGKTNPCLDNPLGAALLATLRKVAFPDDFLSLAISNGFPAAWGCADELNFRKHTLESLARLGYAGTIRVWIDSASLEGEPFLKDRAAAFLLAAEEFDACRKPGDGILDFLRFVEKRQTQETEASGVVRIMTIHQSKGLGFDMVIASGLDKKGRANDGNRIALGPALRAVKWGILLPAKEFAEQDETLRTQLEIDDAESKYGNLCKAYVALTRAKKALYVVTTELGEKTKSKNFARHLQLQFGNPAAQFGEADWFEQFPIITEAASAESTRPAFVKPAKSTPKPVSPSSFKDQASEGRGFLTLSQEASELGTEVHEALAGMEWMETTTLQLGNLSIEAANLVRGFLKKPIAQEVFTKPEQPHDLWRERAFDVTLDGQWVSGVFDRVVVHRSDEGAPLSATIYDFKTDHGSAAEIDERYAGQMEVYRKAVCQLLSLSSDYVKSQILCVR